MKIAAIIAERSQHEPSDLFMQALRAYVSGQCHAEITDFDWADVQAVFDAEMPRLAESYRVWRGWSLKSWNDLRDPAMDFRHHDVIRTAEYVATTADRSTAMEFLERGDRDGHRIYIMFEIATMAGARGINVDDYAEYNDAAGYEDYNKWESEILLPPGSEFRVIAKQQRDHDSSMIAWHDSKTDKPLEHWKVKLEQVK